MTEREKLIEIVEDSLKENIGKSCNLAENIVDDIIGAGVIVPPVKVGDTVYMHGEAVEISFMHIDKEGTIYCIQFDCSKFDCDVCPFYEDDFSFYEGEHDCITNGYIEFTANDIGKTVFLTREEAEKALAERSNTQ